MRKILLLATFCFCSLFFTSMQAQAMTKNYVVAPFVVNGSDQYKYLETSFASMLSSRLFTHGQYETASRQDSIIKSKAPTNKAEAQKLLDRSKADFIFYGSITIMGSEASIDVISLDKEGKQVQEATSTPVDSLISSVQGISDSLKISVFTINSSQDDFVLTATGRTSMFVQNQKTENEARLRSQILDFATITMDIGDYTGNGVQDIILGDNNRTIYLYEWNNGSMKKLAEHRIPSSQHILLVRTIKQEGKDLILLSTFAESQLKPTGTILEFDGKKIKQYTKKTMPFFVNTLIDPENGNTKLIGQAINTSEIFRGDVFEVTFDKNNYAKAESIPNLPRNANLYNFSYLPDNKGVKNLVVLNASEELQLVSPQFGNIYQTDESYSGGNAFLRTSNGGLTSSVSGEIIAYFYIPMRMVALDIHNDKNYDILVNYPISTRAKLFSNYRNYPEGEVHALDWDGIAFNLNWKTETIKGTVADFQVADLNNNGKKDLVTCMVTYPGALGFGDKKTVITLYPLEEIAQ